MCLLPLVMGGSRLFVFAVFVKISVIFPSRFAACNRKAREERHGHDGLSTHPKIGRVGVFLLNFNVIHFFKCLFGQKDHPFRRKDARIHFGRAKKPLEQEIDRCRMHCFVLPHVPAAFSRQSDRKRSLSVVFYCLVFNQASGRPAKAGQSGKPKGLGEPPFLFPPFHFFIRVCMRHVFLLRSRRYRRQLAHKTRRVTAKNLHPAGSIQAVGFGVSLAKPPAAPSDAT